MYVSVYLKVYVHNGLWRPEEDIIFLGTGCGGRMATSRQVQDI